MTDAFSPNDEDINNALNIANMDMGAQNIQNKIGGLNQFLSGLDLEAKTPQFNTGLTQPQIGGAGITAYHGSPYEFEQFDTSKIGTGEGAQAYGHGLYFAEHEPVAKSYKENLTNPTLEYQGTEYGSPKGFGADARARILDDMRSMGKDQALQKIKDNINFNEKYAPDMAAIQKSDLDWAKLIDPTQIVQKNFGHMYEVAIDAHPDHFLDWDKPLSEQSEHVQNAIKNVAYSTDYFMRNPQKYEGEVLYEELKEKFGDKKASQLLGQHGIKGIKYLDQGSRAQGEGTRNYVVFDPNDIEIMRRYALGGNVTHGHSVPLLLSERAMKAMGGETDHINDALRIDRQHFDDGGGEVDGNETITHALRLARSLGRGHDTILAHINPREAALLKKRGGSGKINPYTGLPEFDDGDGGGGGDGEGDQTGGDQSGNQSESTQAESTQADTTKGDQQTQQDSVRADTVSQSQQATADAQAQAAAAPSGNQTNKSEAAANADMAAAQAIADAQAQAQRDSSNNDAMFGAPDVGTTSFQNTLAPDSIMPSGQFFGTLTNDVLAAANSPLAALATPNAPVASSTSTVAPDLALMGGVPAPGAPTPPTREAVPTQDVSFSDIPSFATPPGTQMQTMVAPDGVLTSGTPVTGSQFQTASQALQNAVQNNQLASMGFGTGDLVASLSTPNTTPSTTQTAVATTEPQTALAAGTPQASLDAVQPSITPDLVTRSDQDMANAMAIAKDVATTPAAGTPQASLDAVQPSNTSDLVAKSDQDMANALAIANGVATSTQTSTVDTPDATNVPTPTPRPDQEIIGNALATAATLQQQQDPYASLINQPGWDSDDPSQIAEFNQNASNILGYTVGPESTQGVLAAGQRTPATMVPVVNADGTITMQPTFGSTIGGIVENMFAPSFVGVNDPNYAKMASQTDNATVSGPSGGGGRTDVTTTGTPVASTTPATPTPKPYVPPKLPGVAAPYVPSTGGGVGITPARTSTGYLDLGAAASVNRQAAYNHAVRNALRLLGQV